LAASTSFAGRTLFIELLRSQWDVDAAEQNSGGWQSPLAVSGSTWYPDYSDIREDRVIIYGYASHQVQEFVYQIKSTNTGSFVIPPAYGEAMYDREIQAVSAQGGKLNVVPAGEK